jgi:hypothetical protein
MTIYYKGFDAKLMCRNHRFEVGKTYSVSGKVKACNNGFHSCPDNPLNVLDYVDLVQPDGSLTRFAECEIGGATDTEGTKIASAEITVKVELSLPDFIKKAVKWVVGNTALEAKKEGGSSQLAASGHSSQLAASGDYSVISSSGIDTTATGVEGTWISLAEFNSENKCIGFAIGCVGQDGLKANTQYKALGGKLVEVSP